MAIDINSFTPLNSLAGGVLIGASVALLLLVNGKVAGVSGIIYQTVKYRPEKAYWRIWFILGLLASTIIWKLFKPLPAIEISANIYQLILSGFLVGLGTAYANGCTSGHGICGLARLSIRSLVATLLFMSAAFVTVYLTHHVFLQG